jgi:hypothetical protein
MVDGFGGVIFGVHMPETQYDDTNHGRASFLLTQRRLSNSAMIRA